MKYLWCNQRPCPLFAKYYGAGGGGGLEQGHSYGGRGQMLPPPPTNSQWQSYKRRRGGANAPPQEIPSAPVHPQISCLLWNKMDNGKQSCAPPPMKKQGPPKPATPPPPQSYRERSWGNAPPEQIPSTPSPPTKIMLMDKVKLVPPMKKQGPPKPAPPPPPRTKLQGVGNAQDSPTNSQCPRCPDKNLNLKQNGRRKTCALHEKARTSSTPPPPPHEKKILAIPLVLERNKLTVTWNDS